ncbi:solute carrier organic anion transporter family member 1C1-like isoform X2 [Neopelma chrysocephalum]|uniref:solute carrier organic anion transporter family member 1C1-like isoform X2 n=1 Tax=Neopelma chrysocephalum TaxID=114329 RepID=UPI000FCD2C8D|nr:solute carrier organic anion transporter family member 1C1-like isoform X2 [Neopelma chrysocephalum]
MTVETKSSDVNGSNQEAEPNQPLDDEENKTPPVKKKTSSCSGLKAFLAALSFSYFSKTFSGVIMKSSITQIERRFDLTSSTAGFVDGSFEMGNLLVIAFVSYFGAKLHRPKVIAVGCFTMALGCFLSAMPHFFMGYYKYETASHRASSANSTSSINPCSLHQDVNDTILGVSRSGCEKEPSSYMWIYILLGNMLRGIGETPITPLGISYLDDFAKEENVPVYVACLHTIAMFGPMFGFLLGSLCAKLYVDVGFVDPDFCASLKKVLSNRMYFTFLCCSLLQFSSFIGFITYKPKYMEQQYGQSTSKSNFLIGITSLPPVGIGIFLGGFIMKKYKMGIVAATKFSFTMSFLAYAISFLHFFVGCENYAVAGMTVSYEGEPIPFDENAIFSDCNSHCKCASNVWDPVCGDNGITYVSACLAGCESSVGHGKNTVFQNCRCLEISSSWTGNNTATLGQCPKSEACSMNFIYYTVIQVIGGFCYSLGGTPAYMIMFRCVQPEFKALAVGLYTLVMRMLAGIPAPVYFGAVIDKTCLKWGSTSCGQRGACRLYDSVANRYVFLGLSAVLRGPSYFIAIIFYILIKKHFQNKDSKPIENGQEDAPMNKEENCKIKQRLPGSPDGENESSI